MTENAISQAALDGRTADEMPLAFQPTPLAQFHTLTGAAPELAAYRGVLTAKRLDAQEKETEALVSAVAVHDLGWLRRVAVRGEDRFRWLNGMVTNMVNDLAVKGGAWNLVLNAQGRIQGELYVWRDGDQLELEIAADQYDRLLAHFDRFIIMDDVELVPLSFDANGEQTGETALGLAGPLAEGLLARLGLIELNEPLTSARTVWNGFNMRVVRAYGVLTPHYELWVQAAQVSALWQTLTGFGAIPVGAASFEALRVAEGIPAYGIDLAERDLPQETSQMRALHFSKGCYLGQEIVERIRSRGNVHRHLRQLELFGPLPPAGCELMQANGAVAGQITSAAVLPLMTGHRTFALGMIRGEAEISLPRNAAVAGESGNCNQLFNYSAENAQGTARILTGPPEMETS